MLIRSQLATIDRKHRSLLNPLIPATLHWTSSLPQKFQADAKTLTGEHLEVGSKSKIYFRVSDAICFEQHLDLGGTYPPKSNHQGLSIKQCRKTDAGAKALCMFVWCQETARSLVAKMNRLDTNQGIAQPIGVDGTSYKLPAVEYFFFIDGGWHRLAPIPNCPHSTNIYLDTLI